MVEEQTKVPEVSPEEVELTKQIAEIGDKIKEAKAAGKPKDEWDPFLQEMLELKVRGSREARP